MRWDPQQYARFADERARPFHDLIARIGIAAPRHVVDVGCGPGALTTLLAQRWPGALVEGFDPSPEMISAAAELAGERLTFRVEDAATWQPNDETDVIVSNAALQWVPSHRPLVARWAGALPSGGWLAFQVPGNFDSPSHTIMRSLASAPQWTTLLAGILRHDNAVGTPAEYAALLLGAGLVVDVWDTTYQHVLTGEDPVLDWLRGTGLRPVLAALSPEDGARFCAEFAAELRRAYPPTAHGTLFAFRRVFAVGRKP